MQNVNRYIKMPKNVFINRFQIKSSDAFAVKALCEQKERIIADPLSISLFSRHYHHACRGTISRYAVGTAESILRGMIFFGYAP